MTSQHDYSGPRATPEKTERPSGSSSVITPDIVREHGLNETEYQRLLSALGRIPNMLELGIYSVMWSEHCSYKSSRRHLKKLPTSSPLVIEGPGENAGVIDIGDGQAAIFKMESHNHPSFIEPYQGAATGVGGILRDVFTMGARPVANMNALRFGDPDHPKTKHLLSGVIAGIGGYGNCVGVPTVGGETNFDPAYNGNILVNAMTVGIADANKIFRSAAAGLGNPVVYVGSRTGRDGIHGATMASAEFTDDTDEKRPTVQVGDPFTEKLLIEACLELMATDAIVAIQDMGAAGLTSSSVEMASKGNVGLRLDLDNVPQREEAMQPYEMMLSESQERMLMVLVPGKEAMAEAIFHKWGLDFAVIGEIIEGNSLTLTFKGDIVADIPVPSLVDDAPEYDRPFTPTKVHQRISVPAVDDMNAALINLMGSANLCSREWIWRQYDWRVMADTIAGPGGDAALVRVHGTNKALALSTDVTPRYVKADPFTGGAQAVAETWRNITATGGDPIAITNCLNFGNPERPEIMGQLVGALEGMTAACKALDYPVVSGNVSLYNETNGVGILPTPAIGGVGVLKNLDQRASACFGADGQAILLIGATQDDLCQSVYARDIVGIHEGPPPALSLSEEKKNGDFIRAEIQHHGLRHCHDLSDGGLAVALAEMALAANRGADIQIGNEPHGASLSSHALLFSESQSRYLITVAQGDVEGVLHRSRKQGVICQQIGQVGNNGLLSESKLVINDQIDIPLSSLRQAHESFFTTLMTA